MLDHGAFVASTQTCDLSIDLSMAYCSRGTNWRTRSDKLSGAGQVARGRQARTHSAGM